MSALLRRLYDAGTPFELLVEVMRALLRAEMIIEDRERRAAAARERRARARELAPPRPAFVPAPIHPDFDDRSVAARRQARYRDRQRNALQMRNERNANDVTDVTSVTVVTPQDNEMRDSWSSNEGKTHTLSGNGDARSSRSVTQRYADDQLSTGRPAAAEPPPRSEPALVKGVGAIGPPPAPPAWFQVYEHWDRMVMKAGLPGPVTRNNARKQAILRKLTEYGMFTVLGVIDEVARSHWLTGRKKAGQSAWWGSFDWVFEVGSQNQTKQNFLRIVEGVFGNPVPRTAIEAQAAAPPAVVRRPPRLGERPEILALRTELLATIGPISCATWIDPVEFVIDGPGELMIVAPSAYHAEQLETRYRHLIEQAASSTCGTTTLFFRVAKRAATG